MFNAQKYFKTVSKLAYKSISNSHYHITWTFNRPKELKQIWSLLILHMYLRFSSWNIIDTNYFTKYICICRIAEILVLLFIKWNLGTACNTFHIKIIFSQHMLYTKYWGRWRSISTQTSIFELNLTKLPLANKKKLKVYNLY